MTNLTKRLALPVVLAGGLALSACSFTGGSDDEGADAPTTSRAASSTTATTPPAASTTAAPSTSAAVVTAAPEPSGADPTTAGGLDRCHTSELTGALDPADSAAGNRYATLTLANTGGEVCTIYGYGGIGLSDLDGTAVPTNQVRVDPAPRTVTLQPGQAVVSTLHWTDVATGDEPTTGDCEPEAGRLTVIPPDETDSISVTWSYGPVCGAGRIEQTAYTTP